MADLQQIFDLGHDPKFRQLSIPGKKEAVLDHLASLGLTTEAEVRHALSHAIRMVDKRYQAIEKLGGSPATEAMKKRIEEAGVKIPFEWHVRGRETDEILDDFIRAQYFDTLKTSSVSGRAAWKNNSIEQLEKKRNIKITSDNFDRLWKTYKRYMDLHPEADDPEFKYTEVSRIYGKIVIDPPAEGTDPDKYIDDLIADLEAENRKREQEIEAAEQAAEAEYTDPLVVGIGTALEDYHDTKKRQTRIWGNDFKSDETATTSTKSKRKRRKASLDGTN